MKTKNTPDRRTMSLRDLHQRLGQIIEQNDRNPTHAADNDLPVFMEIDRGTRAAPMFVPIGYGLSNSYKLTTADGEIVAFSAVKGYMDAAYRRTRSGYVRGE